MSPTTIMDCLDKYGLNYVLFTQKFTIMVSGKIHSEVRGFEPYNNEQYKIPRKR